MDFNYPFPADIAEMKAQGYEVAAIAEAERRWAACEPVYRAIQTAFADVTLGNGVGLSQGDAIDDCEDEAVQAAYRANDEKEDWRRIPPADLYRYHVSLCYFDAEGMRFYLPAFLLATLHGDDLLYDTRDHLVCLKEWQRRRFSLLNAEQKAAVRAFLILDGNNDEDTARALKEYWSEEI